MIVIGDIHGQDLWKPIVNDNIDLELLDPTGVVIEKWILQGCILTNVDFGALGYSTDALVDISATIQPDRCILVY